ncbi:similar to Saccharomyces cerevisiae YMR019W STB4 Protein that binds Sin3p in a two-hybrid assay [Maudiozyma saulgeensis]|uniref:Similar to Saccharomyces cerevisiae YMR019W STB4 Protein that binds Sin3p in a two-hybrid assay n=1 Tax=Maudiozyma saulgeensis TaxID=1789683 RepID=A0A1X7R7X0_9SACH|nr:similar to Saccharomyces cerevisiae YMR019W STB4 Protein that binds Sin3p in a two-hybrid assay [Kazachstania saulgeensis]
MSSAENSPTTSLGAASSSQRKRIRVGKACEDCKRRKVKCDGNSPCHNCVAHQVACAYDYSSGKPRGKYKKKSKLNGNLPTKNSSSNLNDSNGVYLEDQTAKLLLQLSSKLDSNNGQDNEDKNTPSSSDFNSSRNNTGTTTTTTTTNNTTMTSTIGLSQKGNDTYETKGLKTDNVSPWFCYSYEKYRFHTRYQNILPFVFGNSAISDLPEEIITSNNLEVPRVQNYGWNLSGGHYLKLKSLNAQDLQIEILNFDNPLHVSIVKKLLIYYFSNINKPFSIIHERMFWQQFNNGFLQQRKTSTKSTKLFLSILYLLLTIALRFHDGETTATSPIDFTEEELSYLTLNARRLESRLFSYSYTVVTKLTFEWESFELIQSWLLMTFYLRTSHRQIAAWNALSKAIHMCKGMSLELNRLPTRHKPGDVSKAWHCFWLCFIMDKMISFQIGRKYQLDLPIESMTNPLEHYKDENIEWFHDETIQMYQLSLLIVQYQKPYAQELTVSECNEFRSNLKAWLATQLKGNFYDLMTSNYNSWEIQPLMTYLDIALTFECKSVLSLLNPPNESLSGSLEFNVDFDSLLSTSELALSVLEKLSRENLYFIPWWLNLSVLFTVSIANLVLTHSGIRYQLPKNNLERCMALWNNIESTSPRNPPSMLAQCVWCLKMLNYISCLRLVNTAQILRDTIGVDLKDNTPNKNNFHQFSKDGEEGVDEDLNETHQHSPSLAREPVPRQQGPNSGIVGQVPTNGSPNLLHILAPMNSMSYPNVPDRTPMGASGMLNGTVNSTPSDILEDDLFANLQWFDQTFV